MLIVAVHAILSLAIPASIWVTSSGIGTCCLLAAALAVCEGRDDDARRWRWWLMASTFVIWAAAFAAIAWLQAVHSDTSHARIDSFLFMARAAPLFIVLTQDRRETPGAMRWIGFAQALLFVLLTGALLFPALLAGVALPVPLTSNIAAMDFRQVENFGIALLALVAWRIQSTVGDRRFAGIVAALLVSYVIVAQIVNARLESTSAPLPGSPLMIAGDLPIAIFAVMTLWRRRDDETRPLALGPVGEVVWLLTPTFVVAGTLAVAFALASRLVAVAVAGAALSLGLYAARSVLLQRRDTRTQAALIAAHDAMERLTRLDPLTGIANRRSFDATLPLAAERAADAGEPLTLILIDIDDFKALNDRTGHVTGDACLRLLAVTMRAAVRSGDVLARYGGEEFAVIAAGLDARDGTALAEDIRASVEAIAFPHPALDSGVVTISAGVTTRSIGDAAPSAIELLRRADAALYSAKHRGRNRVTTWSPADPEAAAWPT